jgi:hypothetical protein
MNRDIFQRRLLLDRAEREARRELLRPHRQKFDVMLFALQYECEQLGHTLEHDRFNVGGDRVLRCTACGRTKVEEG